jgi:hypothetical protein
MSAWTCRRTNGKADQKIVPPRLRIPWWKGPGADSEEKHEPASDIDTAPVGSLKALDPNQPIREADIRGNVLEKKPRPPVDNRGSPCGTAQKGQTKRAETRHDQNMP